MNDVRKSSSRVDVIRKLVYEELDTLDSEWMCVTLEELLRRYWMKHSKEVRWGKGIDNPIKNMPVISNRSSHITFIVYSLQSPDRNLQLAIALVKSICKDYDKLADITEAGEYACPMPICETDPCTIAARDILSKLYN